MGLRLAIFILLVSIYAAIATTGSSSEGAERSIINFKRQTGCNRQMNLNCRLTLGKKRSDDTKSVRELLGSTLYCLSSNKRTSILCKLMSHKRLRKPCDAIPGGCEDQYKIRAIQGGHEKEETKSDLCDPRSPFCYTTIPGKRLGWASSAHALEFKRRQDSAENKEKRTEDLEDDVREKRCTNAKSNYFCRYRIPGKRSLITESSVKNS